MTELEEIKYFKFRKNKFSMVFEKHIESFLYLLENTKGFNVKKNRAILENIVGAQMAIATQLIKNSHNHAITQAGFDITIEQFGILGTLNRKGAMKMSQISVELWKHNANITRIVDKLEQKSLVKRAPLINDRRAHLVSITPTGNILYENILSVIEKNNDKVFSCLSENEKENLLLSAKSIISHLMNGSNVAKKN